MTSSSYFVEFGYDFTSVYNGPDENAPLIEKFTGKVDTIDKVSNLQSMTVRFESDYTGTKQGFEMNVLAFSSGMYFLYKAVHF